MLQRIIREKEQKKEMSDIKETAKKMKELSPKAAVSPIEKRNDCLLILRRLLEERKEEIFKANKEDLYNADKEGISESVKKRLKFDENKLRDSMEGLFSLASLSDPINNVDLKRELDDDLILKRISVPIGVIGVIFEARPDAMIQVSSLLIKSGNSGILKGGKETINSNRILFSLIKEALKESGLYEDSLFLAEQHSEIDELLKCDESVDLIIPRGSNGFVRYIMENTKIPVMGHSSGVCHIYVDEEFDPVLSNNVIIDSKTQYAAACNAVETVLINKKIINDYFPVLYKELKKNNVKVRGDKRIKELFSDSKYEIEEMGEDEYDTEYGDLAISIKEVESVFDAISHINSFGSHHTDAIITKIEENAAQFSALTDSAGVYINCSTRFADGFRYGFGAEVGISTGKIHARGPVGLFGLTTYKYILEGKGNIVKDYSSGEKHFTHKDLDI